MMRAVLQSFVRWITDVTTDRRPPTTTGGRWSVVGGRSLLALLALALAPGAAQAAGDCESWEPARLTSCQIDAAQYDMLEGLAGTAWLVDRVLLGAAYYMDVLRTWLVQTAFASAYDALTAAVGPLLAPMATLALVLGALALIAMPVTGSSGPINIRTTLLWCLVGPLALTLSGPFLGEFEHIRTDLGATLFGSVAAGSFGSPRGAYADMARPTAIYPSEACGTDAAGQPALGRFGATDTPGVDEQVAALVWADAQDIHCPNAVGPSSSLPDRFYSDAPDGPGFLHEGGVRDLDAAERQRYIGSAKEAINRLLLALLPSGVAMLVALLHLLFACCSILLWCSLPLGVLFSFFQPDASWLTRLIRRGAAVLRTSWMISVLLGIFVAALADAGQAGDALRYSIVVIICGLFAAKFALIAFGLLGDSLGALAETTGMSGGPSVGALAGGALTLAGGAATGGAATALSYGVALRQTGSRRYAASAAAGRIKPLMQLGEVAHGMGLLDDEIHRGLHAGQRSTHSFQAGRLAMQRDALAADEAGVTLRERALDRQIARAEARLAPQPSVAERANTALDAAGAYARQSYDAASGFAANVALRAADPGDPAQIAASAAATLGERWRSGRRAEAERRLARLKHQRARLRALGRARPAARAADGQAPSALIHERPALVAFNAERERRVPPTRRPSRSSVTQPPLAPSVARSEASPTLRRRRSLRRRPSRYLAARRAAIGGRQPRRSKRGQP